MSIISAPTAKLAVSYDPETKALVYEKAEIIGIVQLENPEEPEEVQLLPCYLISNKYGFFWVPELEYNFLQYIPTGCTLTTLSDYNQERIKDIDTTYALELSGPEEETIEVVTRGKVSQIKRNIKFTKKKEDDETPGPR